MEINVFGPVVLQSGSVVLSMALPSASVDEDHISLGMLFAKPGTASKPAGSQSTQVSKGRGRKDPKSKSDKDGIKKERKRRKKGGDEGDEDDDKKEKKSQNKKDHKGAEDDDRKGKKNKKKEEHKSDDESGTEASTEKGDGKSEGVLNDDTQEQWIREMSTQGVSADTKMDTETQGDNVDESDGTEKAEQLRAIAESRARMDGITAPIVALFESREVPQDAPSAFGLGSISAALQGDFSRGGKTAITSPFALCPSHCSPQRSQVT